MFQKAKGIEDHPDAHYADNMRISSNTVDPVVTRMFVDNAGDSINWLGANGFKPLDDHPVLTGGHEPFTTRRYQWHKNMGLGILATMEPLYKAAEKSGKVTTLMSTGVVDLVQDKAGAVVGVTTEDDDGNLEDYMGKHVILACGGCAANPRMYADLHGVQLTANPAYPYSQGTGLTLGVSAGGYIRGGEKYLGSFGSILADDNYPSTNYASFVGRPSERAPWELYVNAYGERFMREDHPSVDYREHALTRQPGQRMWVVADQEMIEKAEPFVRGWDTKKVLEAFNNHPMFSKAENLDTLGAKTGINPVGLAASAATYNRAIAEGATDPFGRQHRPMQFSEPPFYAVRITSYSLISFAGLAIDSKLRVIRSDGTPVPNLYAAGEVIGAGATSGNSYCSGSLVTPAVTFGRLLGQRLLNFNT